MFYRQLLLDGREVWCFTQQVSPEEKIEEIIDAERQTFLDFDYVPHYKGTMNRFKVTIKDKNDIAVVYLYSRRNASKTKYLNSLLKVGNRLSAELTIIQDPESGGERNVAMITKIISSASPSTLPLTA